MKKHRIEVDLGKMQIDYELDAKSMSCTMSLPRWRVRWLLIKAGLKIMFSK